MIIVFTECIFRVLEVIVLDGTLDSLKADVAADVVGVLHQHALEKGLLQPEQSKASRRPRTVSWHQSRRFYLTRVLR